MGTEGPWDSIAAIGESACARTVGGLVQALFNFTGNCYSRSGSRQKYAGGVPARPGAFERKIAVELIDKLVAQGRLGTAELTELLRFRGPETTQELFGRARAMRDRQRKDRIQIWGRIPVSSYCKYDCKMCGLRRENQFAKRFRMDLEMILSCCREYWSNGVRHFWLESGDDAFLTEKKVSEILEAIREQHGDCQITLAFGEKSIAACRRWRRLGAGQYILCHGCANEQQYKRIYPSNMSQLLRRQQLWEMREAGYRVGDGFLVGLPYQTMEHVVEDMEYLKGLRPDCIDIGAFVPAGLTPFERERSGNGDMVLYIMAVLRLMLPEVEIIASPTLDMVLKDGRIRAFDAGANILLVDAVPQEILERYGVYKRRTGRADLPPDSVKEMKTVLQIKGLIP